MCVGGASKLPAYPLSRRSSGIRQAKRFAEESTIGVRIRAHTASANGRQFTQFRDEPAVASNSSCGCSFASILHELEMSWVRSDIAIGTWWIKEAFESMASSILAGPSLRVRRMIMANVGAQCFPCVERAPGLPESHGHMF